MKNSPATKKRDPFPFVLEELSPIRPTIKHWFGFTSLYLDEKLLCSLRDSPKQPGSNGMWLYTTSGTRGEFGERISGSSEATAMAIAFGKQSLGCIGFKTRRL